MKLRMLSLLAWFILSKKAIQELISIKDELKRNDSSLRKANLSSLIELLENTS